MKALVLKNPGQFAIEDHPMPVPADGEVLLKILRVGVCGTDLHAWEGTQPFFSYPRVLGHEIAARVEQIPAAAKSAAGALREGDIVSVLPYLNCGTCIACRAGKPNCCTSLQCLGVHTDGAMREYIAIDPRYLVPAAALKPEDIAAVECFSIGFHSVRRANITKDMCVLVVGAGPIGIGVIHGLKACGAETGVNINITVLDLIEKRLRYAADICGADSVTSDPRTFTGGELFPLVIDATGSAAQMMKSFSFASSGGALVFAGLTRQEITFPDPLLHAKELTLMASRNALREDFANVIGAIRSGTINTAGFVTHQAGMKEAASSFDTWLDPETGCIKAVITTGE